MVNAAAALDSLADIFEALNTASYQWATSDAWKRARTWPPEAGWTRHLEFYPDIMRGGQLDASGRSGLLSISMEFVFAVRWVPSDDYRSEGRAWGAILAAWNALDDWEYEDSRIRTTGYQVTLPREGWAEIRLFATLTTGRP